jgi:hypothetical protein
MKLSSHPFQIKPTALLLILIPLVCGCAPVVAEASFAARSDTVEPGDLLGPFSGQVLDVISSKPIPDAIVQGSWSFELGRGLTAPAGAQVATVVTDKEGLYRIERLREVPSAQARVVSFTLIIYKRGYVAYRSDRVFEPDRARTDFYQTRNVVRLERMTPSVSRVKHVRFVGGAGELKRALGSEIVEASLELTAGPPRPRVQTASAGPPLDISVLISVDELRAVTGFNGAFAIEKLGDYPTSESYDSRHFRAVNRSQTYDAAIRVWKLPPTAADARYLKLMSEIPHAEEKDEMGDRSLRGYDDIVEGDKKGRIVAVAAEDRARGVVIELTCGLDQCRDADQAAALLRRVLARDDRLGSEPAAGKPVEGAPPESALPESKSPPEEKPPASKEPSEQPAPESKPEPDDQQFKLKPPELKR